MITFDFEYYRPNSIQEAVAKFTELDRQNKLPMYYGGGTEIISMGRMDNISAGAVIDYKEIPECKVMEFQNDHLVIGAGLTLTQIHEANYFPLLSLAGARVADHTIQNKITLGGNLCGTIIYKESVLPLLLADSEIIVSGPQGDRHVPINQIFKERMNLNKGELITQVITKKKYTSVPHIHVKKTRQDKINYPLITICAMRVEKDVRVGISGLCSFPFRSEAMEYELNNRSVPLDKRIDKAITQVPGPVLTDLEGSAEYRQYVLRILLTSIITELEGK